MNEQRISLDLAKRTGNQQVVIAQGDAAGTTIIATVYDNGTRLVETGVSAALVMELPDGTHYVRDAADKYENGVITYTCDENRIAPVAGYTDNAYFELRKGGEVASTERFSVHIMKSAYDGHEPADDWDNLIAALSTTATQAVETANTAAATATQASWQVTQAIADASSAAQRAESAASSANSAASSARQATTQITGAENSRVQAENSRVQAENSRVQAENSRVSEFAAIRQDAQEAIQNANSAARWEWGTVVSVGADGTMSVNIGGTTLSGIRAAKHVMGASAGDSVRVMRFGADAVVDAVSATGPVPQLGDLLYFTSVSSEPIANISSGSIGETSAVVPTVPGYTFRGIVQTWRVSGTENILIGAPARQAGKIWVRVRANVAATNVVVGFFLLYTLDT